MITANVIELSNDDTNHGPWYEWSADIVRKLSVAFTFYLSMSMMRFVIVLLNEYE